MTALLTLAQEDFAAGMVRSVARHLIPENGVYDARNGLLDDDGSLYRRGGSAYKSAAFIGTGLRALWEAQLPVGRRTVVASDTDYGVMAADDSAAIQLGGAGITHPERAVIIGGLLVIGGTSPVLYGGSRKAADYSTGTAGVTNGSAVVSGGGTAWVANVDAGMLFKRTGDARYYIVQSVDSDAQVTLTEPYAGVTGAGVAYTLTRLGTASEAAAGIPVSRAYAVAGGRLWACSGNEARFSEGVDPDTGALRPYSFPLAGTLVNLHELPQGAQIIGAEGLRDRVLLFTTAGLWQISNIAFNVVDVLGNPGHRQEQVSADLVMWGPTGVASWQNGLIVAATDGVYLVDGISAPVLLTRSITPLYVSYVRAGHSPGQAEIYRNHLYLPILNATAEVVDLLICRLDRAAQTRLGLVFPWTRADGHGGEVTALARRVGAPGSTRSPVLLGAGRGDTRVLNLSGFFEPSAAVKRDADATTHQFVVETRDYPTGKGRNANEVRRARVRYELVDAASDNPVVTLGVSVGELTAGTPLWGASTWGGTTWASSSEAEFVLLEGSAPESNGRRPWAWRIGRRTQYVRYRITVSLPCSRAVLRSIESFTRESRKAA